MPFDNRQFALLAVLCGLAVQSFSGVGIRAAVVHRQPKAGHANQFARHDVGKVADYDAGNVHHDQAAFSFPWSRKGDAPSKQSNDVRRSEKSSIAISNAHGAKYTINHRRQATTPQWISTPSRNSTQFNSTASTSSTSPPTGMPGTVAIVSRNSNPDNDRILASLFLVEKSDGTYVLDASERNATEVVMTPVPMGPSSERTANAGDTYPVRLAMPIDGASYCATYDQAPPNPEPLTAQRCMADGVRTEHTSQIFLYTPSSGNIQPTSQRADAEDAGVPSASSSTPSSPYESASAGAGAAGVVVSSDSAAPAPSASASSASWNRREDGTSFSAQNVTLVFVPKRMGSNAAAVQEASTSTVTQTVIVFSSASSPSASAVNAADTTPTPVVSSSGSAAMAGVTGLSVEVVGLPQVPVALPSVVTLPGKPAASPASSSSPSPSMDAAVVPASYSASSGAAPTTTSPSAAAVAGVASLSSSDNSAASMSSFPASSSARDVFERDAMVTPVSTDPYFWRFKAEGKF